MSPTNGVESLSGEIEDLDEWADIERKYHPDNMTERMHRPMRRIEEWQERRFQDTDDIDAFFQKLDVERRRGQKHLH